LLYAREWWFRRWVRLVDGIITLAIAVVSFVAAFKSMGWPTGASWPRWVLIVGSILGTVVLRVFWEVRRTRRVRAAMRRYGVDEALIQETRRILQRPRQR